jgi:hypothetical protein
MIHLDCSAFKLSLITPERPRNKRGYNNDHVTYMYESKQICIFYQPHDDNLDQDIHRSLMAIISVHILKCNLFTELTVEYLNAYILYGQLALESLTVLDHIGNITFNQLSGTPQIHFCDGQHMLSNMSCYLHSIWEREDCYYPELTKKQRFQNSVHLF